MKARINKYFIKLTRKPEEDIINGLVVELSEPQDEYSLPIMKTNINKGQKKYQYPPNMKGKVLCARVELSTGCCCHTILKRVYFRYYKISNKYMNPEKTINENDAIEKAEAERDFAIAEQQYEIEKEEIERLTEEKRREEAESRESDIENGWNPEF